MTKKKIMIVLDSVKLHYLQSVRGGAPVLNYWATESGVELWQSMYENLPSKSVLNMAEDVEYIIDYAYDNIPDIIKENKKPEFNKYKALTNTQIKESGERLKQRVEMHKPDLVIPMGGWACKVLLGSNSITNMRGKPERMNIGSHSTWVIATYSTDAIRVSMKFKPLQTIDLQMIMRFLDQGEEVFMSKDTHYKTYTNQDFDECIKVLTDALDDGKEIVDAVAWDFETNTLSPELGGSKMLTISISRGHGQGYTIPITHPEQPWLPEQEKAIKEAVFKFIESDMYKVGANIQFDMRFAKFHSARTLIARKNLDVQAGYYIAVSQEELDSKGLKTLTYYYTDMGGYDAPVEGFKKFFNSIRSELVKRYDKPKKPELWTEYLEEGFSCLGIALPEFMTQEDLTVTMNTINRLIEEQGTAKFVHIMDGETFSYEWIPYRLLAEYASGDVDATRRINIRLFEDEVSAYDKWVTLYSEHYPDLMNALSDIEVNGMQIDRERLIEIRDAFAIKRDEIMGTLRSNETVKELRDFKEARYQEGLIEKAKKPADRDKAIYAQYTKYNKPESRELNIGSPVEKGLLLFGLTGYVLEANRQTLKEGAFNNMKDGLLKESDINWSHFKTDEDNVKLLMEKYPDFKLGSILLEYGKATKLVTTYTQSILDKSDDNDVVHGQLVSTRTATSRLASRNPNLQNLPRHIGDPRRYDYSFPIKSYFVPLRHLNHDTLVQFDYSAQELRLASVVANDQEMMKAFMAGKDVHKETASITFGVPIEEVTGDLRSDAKAVSFGLLYGEVPSSFAPKHNMTVEEAEQLFDKYYEGKPLFKKMIEDAQNFAKEFKFIEVPGSGFRRKLLDVDSHDFMSKQGALRQALNTVVQGGSAYIMQRAVIIINAFLRDNNIDAKIIVTVHDSLVASTRKELVPMVGNICKTVMENLPLDYLNVIIDGEPVYFKMEADFGVSINYNDECPYDEEMFNASKSSEGYCSWHMAKSLIKDLKENDLIREDYYDMLMEVHNNMKDSYMSVDKLSDDPALYSYHTSTMKLRAQPV